MSLNDSIVSWESVIKGSRAVISSAAYFQMNHAHFLLYLMSIYFANIITFLVVNQYLLWSTKKPPFIKGGFYFSLRLDSIRRLVL